MAWSGERSILPALQPICEEYSNVFYGMVEQFGMEYFGCGGRGGKYFSMSAAVVKSCKIHRRRCPFRDAKGGGGISNRGGQANKFLVVCFVIIAMQYFPQTEYSR